MDLTEKGIYGEQNYEALVSMIQKKAEELGADVEVFQSNHEGAIIDKIQEAYYNDVDGIVINPGAFTHYSYAVRDAHLWQQFLRLRFIYLMYIQEKSLDTHQ